MKKIKMYTDGACRGNPGPGGYACILVYGENEKVVSGGEKETTNNRMELSAVIEGLSALKEPCEITIVSDSKYVVSAINEGWLSSWIKKGWKKCWTTWRSPSVTSAGGKGRPLRRYWIFSG